MKPHRLCLFAILFAGLFSLATAAEPLAWIRFEDTNQRYQGTKYHYLGNLSLELAIAIKPRPGQILQVFWGSKRDLRQAVVTINGIMVPILDKGDRDGFRWLPVAIPFQAIKGDGYQISFSASQTPKREARPAFLAAVALTDDAAFNVLPLAFKSDARGITLMGRPFANANPATAHFLWNLPPPTTEAFPEMRILWDREPVPPVSNAGSDEPFFRQSERNGRLAAEALYRCQRFVHGWLAYADPASGLFPRNLRESRDFWNGRDSAADNYPFMVLTSAFTDRALFSGRMLDMLHAEERLTCRLDRLCDDYSFSKHGFRRSAIQLDDMIFDNAEYVKDGLIPLTEWLGPSPWSERMTGIIEDIWKHAPIDTSFGKIPTLNFEVNGDLLQACSRLYGFTGQRKYLEWAIRLGDYYLLGNHHPTRDMDELRLMDHGCEVINGLSELYVALSVADPAKREAYRAPLHAIYDRILAVGRNPDGLLYSRFNPKTGEHSDGLCDTWGYNYDGFYTMYLLDQNEAYRTAVRQALGNLKGKYAGAPWADKSADGYADSIEGAINLYNRERIPSAADWIDSQIRLMWAKQHADGIIEGWHGDGNFARTSIMFALWKSQGVTVQPWRADVSLGAVSDGKGLLLTAAADRPWHGRLIFDKSRHKVNMHLPLDYPRINQFPEWFTTANDAKYILNEGQNPARILTGAQLQRGLEIDLQPNHARRWRLIPE